MKFHDLLDNASATSKYGSYAGLMVLPVLGATVTALPDKGRIALSQTHNATVQELPASF